MIREFYKKHERHLATFAFLIGFLLDNITLQRIDRAFEHFILLFYLALSGFLIVAYNAFDLDRPREWGISRTVVKIVRWFPIAIQFSFGALFSGSLVFYSRSASLSVSWPFLAILILFIIANELVHTRYGRLTLQISGFFIASFLYASFGFPVLFHRMSSWIFLAGGLASFVLTMILIRMVKWFSRERIARSRFLIYFSVVFLFGLFNTLYFLNVIPPLPLSIKEIGVYHDISRNTSGNYVLRYEPAEWYHLRVINPVFRVNGEGIAYVFSAIFAPAKLSTEIIHEWFRKDEVKDVWISEGTVSFPIVGGRDGGYRGYTSKKVKPGKWRVDVKIQRGALIGRTYFTVENHGSSVPLEILLR